MNDPSPTQLWRAVRSWLYTTINVALALSAVIICGLLALEADALTTASLVACGGTLAAILALHLLGRRLRRRLARG